MRVLIYEDNLMWSSRLVKSLTALGHEPLLRTKPVAEFADFAIVNLGSQTLPAGDLVPSLTELGVKVIGHAGHKERDLLELGRQVGCQILATNSELTFKLENLLTQ
jgi:hypothetical protein